MPNLEPTYHRDGSVTLWNVYNQQWERLDEPSDRILASLNVSQRERVIKHCRIDDGNNMGGKV